MKYQESASRILSSNQAFLQLVRLGIGTEMASSFMLQVPIDWYKVEALAEKQGLLGVVLDGVQCLAESAENTETISYKKRLEWLGKVMLIEQRYAAYCKAIDALAAFYSAHGFRMMLLKGYACGRDWPKPEHRPYGDIDIWLFGKQKEADAALENLNHNDNVNGHKGKVFSEVKIDRSHHHHTVFNWMGFTVENHYDFVNVHARKSSAELEKVFKELAFYNVESGEFRVESQLKGCSVEGCRIPCVEVGCEKVYLPSPNLHALFLIRHMVSHFAAAGITLRQVLDWAFFVEKHTTEMDWEWLDGMLVKYHMSEFFSCINAICVEDLGFQPVESLKFRVESQLESAEFRKLKERVLSDILEPAFTAETPKPLIPRVIFKYRRWKGNSWKHELCYGTSRWDGFWMLLRSHLMKPKVS